MVIPKEEDRAGTEGTSERQRRRRRGKRAVEPVESTRAGSVEKAGFAAIAAPLVGYVIQDLKRPDSLVRSLVGGAIRKFLPEKSEKTKAIDIGDRVEVIESADDRQN